MAVSNTLVPKQEPKELTAVFTANGKEVTLNPETVRRYLVSGNPANVTNEEIGMFINLCKYNGLNPWLKEAYLIKFGNNPATLVTGKEAYMKRAESHPQYDGIESGIIVLTTTNEITYRVGSVLINGEKIIGGWAEVFRKDRSHSSRCEVSINEYVGTTSDGKPNANWCKRPATMIRKVAMVQALREAFPTMFGAMYTAEEQGFTEDETSSQNVPIEDPNQPKQQEQPKAVVVEEGDDLPL